jgi:ribosome maturation factor RimP
MICLKFSNILNLEAIYNLRYICGGNKDKKGTGTVPFSIYYMATEAPVHYIEKLVDNMLSSEPEYFRVNLKIKPTNNVKVFIDGDNGISIEKCVQFNRKLYKMIEDSGIYSPGEFSLEVSSPGVNEPLQLHRQYAKNIGRFIEVIFDDGAKKEGKLVQVAESDIIMEEVSGKGNKAVSQQIVIPFDNIKITTVQIKF